MTQLQQVALLCLLSPQRFHHFTLFLLFCFSDLGCLSSHPSSPPVPPPPPVHLLHFFSPLSFILTPPSFSPSSYPDFSFPFSSFPPQPLHLFSSCLFPLFIFLHSFLSSQILLTQAVASFPISSFSSTLSLVCILPLFIFSSICPLSSPICDFYPLFFLYQLFCFYLSFSFSSLLLSNFLISPLLPLSPFVFFFVFLPSSFLPPSPLYFICLQASCPPMFPQLLHPLHSLSSWLLPPLNNLSFLTPFPSSYFLSLTHVHSSFSPSFLPFSFPNS